MKYELLKDTVLGKAGDIFSYDNTSESYYNQSLYERSDNLSYTREIYTWARVEHNPEWFKKIEYRENAFTMDEVCEAFKEAMMKITKK